MYLPVETRKSGLKSIRVARLVGCIATTPAAEATTTIAATEATATTTTAPSTAPVHARQVSTLRSNLFGLLLASWLNKLISGRRSAHLQVATAEDTLVQNQSLGH